MLPSTVLPEVRQGLRRYSRCLICFTNNSPHVGYLIGFWIVRVLGRCFQVHLSTVEYIDTEVSDESNVRLQPLPGFN